MAIALPEFNGQRFLRALVSMKENAVAIRDQSGDLTYRRINEIQRSLADMQLGIDGLIEDRQAVPAKTFAYLTDRGVTATNFQDLNAKTQALATALQAWRQAVRQTVVNLSGSDLIEVRATNYQGQTLREIVQKNAIPGTTAAPLRASQELADVITALEDLGA